MVVVLEDAKQTAFSLRARFGPGETPGLRPNRGRGCSGTDSLFSASCSNLYADTEAPESSDSLCRSMCSLFVDAAVPVGWEELADTSIAALQDPGHCISERSKTITVYFYLSQMWAAKKPPAPPQLPRETSSGV